MPDASEYVAQMIRSLAVSEPELDTSIGSTARKILDAVAEPLAEASVDRHLLDYQFDLDSKVGEDLDDFVAMFGFSRFQPKRASGVATFSRPSPAQEDYAIPGGTQVSTAALPQVIFSTVAPAVLLRGSASVDVPVQAALGGESGNLAAGQLTRLATPLAGIDPRTTNRSGTGGGTNYETDDALRSRFKRTIFRSMAGTEDMFLGVALEDTTPDNPSDEVATQANVIGASKRWREQVQVAPDGSASSTVPPGNVKYVFPGSSVFGADVEGGQILTQGVHYSFDASVVPPVVRSLGGALVVGEIYDLDFEYAPRGSRNDPLNGITNRVDVWVSGMRAVKAAETSYFRPSRTFTATAGAQLHSASFVRQDTNNVRPTPGNVFVQLSFGPIVTFPESLVVGGTTYVKGADYWVVHDDTAFGYGPTSMFGLEWLAARAPADATPLVLSGGQGYTYNRLPRDVEDRARRWRLVSTDVRAHAAKEVLLRMSFAVMFDPAYDRGAAIEGVRSALAGLLGAKGFNASVQASDVLQTAHNVLGVDNVRFLTSAEPHGPLGSYAVEQVTPSGARIRFHASGSPARASDVYLGDNEVPVLHSVNVVPKAANTFGSS